MSQAIDPRDLRVSDAERAHVMSVLEKATGRGLIDLSEFSERSATVVAARTRGELNAVLLDLPGLTIGGRSVAEAERATAAPGSPAAPAAGLPAVGPPGGAAGWPSTPGTLELTGWGSREFKGYWVAPARIIIGGTGASTRLDFTTAQLTSPTVRVEFQGNAYGSADFIVPTGTSVQFDGLQMRSGHVNNRVPPSPVGGVLHLVLTGVKKGGSVTVRHPRRGLFSGRS